MAVDTSQSNNMQDTDLFAPPTDEEKQNLFAPPKPEELSQASPAPDLFAPPKPGELNQPPTPPVPDFLEDSDINRIATKYKVDPGDLKEVAPYYGAKLAPGGLLDVGKNFIQSSKEAAGFTGRSVGMGLI